MPPTISEHLQIAHSYYEKLLFPSDNVIDATCGNGKDSLFLSTLISEGNLFCYDIQEKAIENTKLLLMENPQKLITVKLIHDSHIHFNEIPANTPIKLITYNLGYLPGGNKEITTMTSATIESIKSGLNLVTANGALSITCYSGHTEGAKEELAIFELLDSLDKTKFNISLLEWPGKDAPSFIWIKKLNSSFT